MTLRQSKKKDKKQNKNTTLEFKLKIADRLIAILWKELN